MDEAGVIDKFLSGHASPLAGLGNVFVAAGRKYGVDPLLPVAISGAESSFGKHILGAHNAWGWGPGIDFGSWEDAISSISKGLRSGYLNEGRNTVAAIGSKWAPQGASNDPGNLNSNWVTNVSDFMRQLGGNPGVSSRRSVTAMDIPTAKTPSPFPTAVPKAQPFVSAIPGAVLQNLNMGLSPTAQLSNLVGAVMADESRPRVAPGTGRAVPRTDRAGGPGNKVSLIPSASPLGPSSAIPIPRSSFKGRGGTRWLSLAGEATLHRVNNELVNRVNALGQYLGKTITVESGYRDRAKQAALYQTYVNSGFNIAHIAAKPGTSNHERGQAMDLTINGVPIANAVPASVLHRFGLHNPVKGDLPHTTLLSVTG